MNLLCDVDFTKGESAIPIRYRSWNGQMLWTPEGFCVDPAQKATYSSGIVLFPDSLTVYRQVLACATVKFPEQIQTGQLVETILGYTMRDGYENEEAVKGWVCRKRTINWKNGVPSFTYSNAAQLSLDNGAPGWTADIPQNQFVNLWVHYRADDVACKSSGILAWTPAGVDYTIDNELQSYRAPTVRDGKWSYSTPVECWLLGGQGDAGSLRIYSRFRLWGIA